MKTIDNKMKTINNLVERTKDLTMKYEVGLIFSLLVVGIMGSIYPYKTIKINKRIELGVGDNYRQMIRYDGMINEKTFVTSRVYDGSYSSHTVRNYYPSTVKEIDLEKKKFGVLKVTPDSLILNYRTSKCSSFFGAIMKKGTLKQKIPQRE